MVINNIFKDNTKLFYENNSDSEFKTVLNNLEISNWNDFLRFYELGMGKWLKEKTQKSIKNYQHSNSDICKEFEKIKNWKKSLGMVSWNDNWEDKLPDNTEEKLKILIDE